MVTADNQKDGAFRARGNAELDRIRTDAVTPANIAEAHASCTHYQTIAAAARWWSTAAARQPSHR